MKIFLIVILVIGAMSQNVSAKEMVGEVINVNYRDRIAFVNLGKESLYSGDILVVDRKAHPIYLEVTQVEYAVTKISPSRHEKYPSDPLDFKDVSVGSVVKRVWTAKKQEKVPDRSTLQSENDFKKKISEFRLAIMSAVVDREEYKKRAEDLQFKVDMLKHQLNQITTIIDEKILNAAQ